MLVVFIQILGFRSSETEPYSCLVKWKYNQDRLVSVIGLKGRLALVF